MPYPTKHLITFIKSSFIVSNEKRSNDTVKSRSKGRVDIDVFIVRKYIENYLKRMISLN